MGENCIANISLGCFCYKDIYIFGGGGIDLFSLEKEMGFLSVNYEGNAFQLLFPSIRHRLDTAKQQRNSAEGHGEDEQIIITIRS